MIFSNRGQKSCSEIIQMISRVQVKKVAIGFEISKIGSKIEDTFESLRRDWFGIREGLHIDSFKKITYVDGYKINLKNIENKKLKNNKIPNEKITNKNLWFVNIGGYDPNSMQEKHEFGLVVAKSSLDAKNKIDAKIK